MHAVALPADTLPSNATDNKAANEPLTRTRSNVEHCNALSMHSDGTRCGYGVSTTFRASCRS